MATVLRVATVNVPIKVGRAAWEKCWLEAAARSDIFGLQECLSLRQRRTFRALARKHGFKQTGLWATPNPIFSRKSAWKRTAARRYRLHYRLLWWKRWPGYNAARWATVGAYKHRKTGARLAVVNAHLVPRGEKVEPGSRKRARVKSIRVLTRILGNQNRLGRPAIVVGDMNMSPPPHLPGVEWLAPGIDQIGVATPPRVRARPTTARPFSAPTDHKRGYSAAITIEEKR